MGEHSGKQEELSVANFLSWSSPESGYLPEESQVQLWDLESHLTTSQCIKTLFPMFKLLSVRGEVALKESPDKTD